MKIKKNKEKKDLKKKVNYFDNGTKKKMLTLVFLFTRKMQ